MNVSCRKEEFYSLNLILKHLQKNANLFLKTTPEPNGFSTAPDFLLDFGTYTVNLEITISGDGFILINGDSKNTEQRESFDRSTYKMLKKLEDLIDFWIKPGESIILIFHTYLPLEK